MDFCLIPQADNPQEPAPRPRPPIWSILVYMLLTETLNISDETLRQKFGLPVLLGDTLSSNLGAHYEVEGHRRSQRLRTTNQLGGYSGKLPKTPGDLVIQCFNGLPMDFSPADTPQSQDGEKQRPFVFLDRYLSGGWSSVYASSISRVIVKLAKVPKKDKAELERQLRNENDVYNKLYCLSRLVVPRCYGEYVWYGGRALVLSDEGPPLSSLGMEFTSLGLVERLVLFGELYLIHYFGVDHRDFEPRNVLRKGWCRLTIIDFAFSKVDHTCPGWRECGELQRVWRKLELERLAFRHRSGILGTVRLVAGIISGLFIIYILLVSFTPSANLPVVGLPVDWRMGL
ncbi:hypothetical protein BJV78DRAFT_323116 [Lactifluus subvellereus]|nr:hypothetical protein BJV78DRAFT_323116 [Lactifluus subvellereus]